MELTFSRQRVILQTTQNLVESGVAEPREYLMVIEQLCQLDSNDTLNALLLSQTVRGQFHACNFYPIGRIWEN